MQDRKLKTQTAVVISNSGDKSIKAVINVKRDIARIKTILRESK